jgi:hypothetical protein
VARALVTLASRKVLTDAQGNFEFPGFTLARSTMVVTKPGYSTTLDGSMFYRFASSPDLTVPVILNLYPNSVITGTVTGRDGLPVVGVQVRLMSANLDVNGLRWIQSGNSITSAEGEYRFNPPPGRYRIAVGYRAKERETGEVVIPVSFPEISSTDKSNYFTVTSGQEQRVDLRARTGPGYPLTLRAETPNGRGLRWMVSTSAGDSFNVGAEAGESGEYLLTLPTGNYTVKAHLDLPDMAEEGSVRVSVTGRQGAAVPIQLAPLTSLPVEVMIDPASTASSTTTTTAALTVNVGQFNLHLHNEKNVGDGLETDISLTYSRAQASSAQAGATQTGTFRVPPGRYRLESTSNGQWHVESATFGQTNLMGGEVVIGQGSTGLPIRLVVDNRTGILTGTVRMPDTLTNAWIYLVSATPTLTVPNPVTVLSPGTFSTREPIGKYHVLALDHQLHMDLRDPDAVKEFSTSVQDVEITSGGTSTIQLDLTREKSQ